MKPTTPTPSLPRLLVRLLVAAAVAAAGAASAATDDDLRRCRGIADTTARLACYDAIVPSAAAAPAPAPTPAPAAAAAPAPAAVFGFEGRAATEAPQAIESRIEGRFEGWGPRSRIRLANGQVWQVIDDSRALMDLVDPKVRVSRASFSTFFLEIEGRNQAPRVKRVE